MGLINSVFLAILMVGVFVIAATIYVSDVIKESVSYFFELLSHVADEDYNSITNSVTEG